MFCVSVKSPSVIQRSVSEENAFKKSKLMSPNYRLKKQTNKTKFFYTKLKTISGFYDSDVWIQGNSTLWPMGETLSCLPLTSFKAPHGILPLHKAETRRNLAFTKLLHRVKTRRNLILIENNKSTIRKKGEMCVQRQRGTIIIRTMCLFILYHLETRNAYNMYNKAQ